MNDLLAAQIVVVATDNAHQYADIAPAAGETWRVISGEGHHAEAAARDCSFAIIDTPGAANMTGTVVSCAQNIRLQLYDSLKSGGMPIVLRAGHTLRFNAAVTVGQVVTVSLFIEKYRGMDTYGA